MKLSKLISALIFVAMLIAGCGGAIDAHIGGTVTGLAGGTSVGLLNNGVDGITVSTNGDFTFSQTVSAGSPYNVTVGSQPTGEVCTVLNGAGNVSSAGGDVTNVQVNCVAGGAATATVTASISGLASGATLVLLNNGVDQLTVVGTGVNPLLQAFPTLLSAGANYKVTVKTQPGFGPSCSLTNAIGIVPNTGNPPSVLVTCP